VLFSCKSKQTSTTKDGTVTAKPVASNIKLIEKFKPVIQGEWVRTDYINGLKQGKTPYELRHKLDGIAEMSIQIQNKDVDSTWVGYSLNNHEGANFEIYYKVGHSSDRLKTNQPAEIYEMNGTCELGYKISGKDTNVFVYHYNKKGTLTLTEKYIRVPRYKSVDTNNAAWGIDYVTRKIIASGKYLATDSLANTFSVDFNENGNVVGFANYKTYDLATDFNGGPANDQDQLYFDMLTKQQDQFLFKLKADTLSLYSVALSEDSTQLRFGKLRYKLVRQHNSTTQPPQ